MHGKKLCDNYYYYYYYYYWKKWVGLTNFKKFSKNNSKFYQLDLSSFIKKYLKIHRFFYKSYIIS